MKKKQQKLDYIPDYNFTLIGIASHEYDYRISWTINQKFNFNLLRTDDLEIIDPTIKSTQSFSVYQYIDTTAALTFNLISNRCNNGFLIEEFKNIDFFLQIFGIISTPILNKFLKDLKITDGLITSVLIDPNSLQSKQKLLF